MSSQNGNTGQQYQWDKQVENIISAPVLPDYFC